MLVIQAVVNAVCLVISADMMESYCIRPDVTGSVKTLAVSLYTLSQ